MHLLQIRPAYLRLSLATGLGIGLSVALLLLPGLSFCLTEGSSIAQAANGVRYVAPGGTDGLNTCTNPDQPCATVQHAVDLAAPGDEIRVATGTYTDVSQRDGITQVVYIDKPVTVRGGFSPAKWASADPLAHPTTLDAGGQGRVMVISGTVGVTVEGLRLTQGDAADMWFRGFGSGLMVATATIVLRDNAVYGNTGSGIALGYSQGTLTGNSVYDNSGIAISLGLSEATLSHNLIYSNTGSGLELFYSSATVSDNTITDNTANYDGGGVFSFGSEKVLLSNNLINNNACLAAYCTGGGVFMALSRDVVLQENIISYNRAEFRGGGVALVRSDAQMDHNTIISNTVPLTGQTGGGVYLNDGSQARLNQNFIAGNEGPSGGGLAVEYNSSAAIENSTIVGNKAGGGGGLFLWTSDAALTNTIIADNQAIFVGSGLYLFASSARLLHTTLARNHGGDGSGLHVADSSTPPYDPSTLTLTNTILVSHTVGITMTSGSTASLEATLWGSDDWANGSDWGGAGSIDTGTINLWGDPAFITLLNGDYRLSPNSAALDQGVNTGVTTDIDGEPRPYGAGYDLGADEGRPSLLVTKQASTDLAQPGAPLTYTLQVTNTGYISLTTTITDILPEHVTPTGILSWTPFIPLDSTWEEQVAVAVEDGYIGPLANVVQVTSGEGASGIYTQSMMVGRLYYLPVIFRDKLWASNK